MSEGLFVYRPGSDSIISYQLQGFSNNSIWAITEDHEGYIWLGTTNNGLFAFHPDKNETKHFIEGEDDRSLSDNIVFTIAEDKEGKLWVGTQNGLNILNQSRSEILQIYHSDSPYSLSSNIIRSIIVDRTGLIWIGTNGGGINIFNPYKNSFSIIRSDTEGPISLSSNNIYVINEYNEGLFIGTSNGLDYLDIQNRTVQTYTNQPGDPNSLPHNIVKSIICSDDDLIYVGSYGGLSIFNQETKTFTNYSATNSKLSSNSITSLVEDYKGNIWIGTVYGGLNYFDTEIETFENQIFNIDSQHIPIGNSIYSLLEDNNGCYGLGLRPDYLNTIPKQMFSRRLDAN